MTNGRKKNPNRGHHNKSLSVGCPANISENFLRHTLLVVLVSAAMFLPSLLHASPAEDERPSVSFPHPEWLDSTCEREQRVDSMVALYLSKEWHVNFSSNNRITVFKRGQEKFDDLFEAIRQARSSIHLEYFNFRNDSISQQLFTLLAECASRGVKVRALFDGFGNSSNNRPLKQKHLEMLREHGIEIYEFDRVRFP